MVSDGTIGGVLRFDITGLGVAGVGASAPVQDALFPARIQAEGIRTAAALHNLEAAAMGVSCRLMHAGVALEAVEIPLEANGQPAWFIDDAFPMSDTSDFLGPGALHRTRQRTVLRHRGGGRCLRGHLHHAAGRGGEPGPGRGDNSGLCAFRQRDLDHRSGVREPGDPAERSSPHPLSYGHPSGPSRYLFLRHRGQPDCRRIGGRHHGRSGGHRGRRSDRSPRDGASGSAHDFDAWPRGERERIGESGFRRSQGRAAPVSPPRPRSGRGGSRPTRQRRPLPGAPPGGRNHDRALRSTTWNRVRHCFGAN